VRNFYEQNPFPNYEEMETVGSLIEKSLDRVFPEVLNRSIPSHTSVLEVGCGTGQLANFLSIANRRVLAVEMCLNSLRLAQRFKTRAGLRNVTFAHMNLFRMPLAPEQFDFVICMGVLHHTGRARQGLACVLPLLKRGGHVILGLYNRYGRMKTRLRRWAFKMLGQRFSGWDPHIRLHDLKGDKRDSWYRHQYLNPCESYHSQDEVLRWFEEEGVDFVRGLPSTVFGARFTLEYRESLVMPESRGSRMDRLLSQFQQMATDTDGGMFTMIGRKQ
jgi:SAM-dependent methyltransferase